MITVEGAKAMVQLIPVLVLVLAVERRSLGPEPEPVRLGGWIWYWAKGIGQSLGVSGSLIAMIPLIACVNTNQPIEGWSAAAIVVTLTLTGQAVIGVVVSLVFREYFGYSAVALGEEVRRQRARDAQVARRYRRARKQAIRRMSLKKRGGGVNPRGSYAAHRSS